MGLAAPRRQEAPSSDAPEPLAIVADEATAAALRPVLRELGWSGQGIQVGRAALLDRLTPADAARPLLLDIDIADGDPALAVQRAALRLGRGARILTLGRTNDVAIFRRLRAAGAEDYLVKPVSAEALRQGLQMAAQARGETGPAGIGKLVVVIGLRGGVGASTLAVNAAWTLAHGLGLKTALVDLDLQFGTAALALDLEPGRGLREALAHPDRLDGFLLAGAMAAESDRLSVLGAEEPVEEPVAFDPTALATLLHELRGGFAMTVVDLPRHLLSPHRRLVAAADCVVLVADLSLAGIRDTVRVQQALTAGGAAARLLVVAGRTVREGKPQVDRATFERSIGAPLAALLPEDGKAVALAANQGKAVGACAAASPLAGVFRSLSETISGTGAPPKPGLLARLLRRPA